MNKYLVLLFSIVISQNIFAEPLLVKNPWIREAPPSARNLAGYAELSNTGKQPITVHGVSSPIFSKVELHVTSFENGMMRMKEIEQLTIKPNETIEFEPGGKHFMLIKPNQAIKSGLIVPLILKIRNEKDLTVNFKVRK